MTATYAHENATPPPGPCGHCGGTAAAGVHRRPPRDEEATVDSRVRLDPRISYSAKGIWAAIAAIPEGTPITIKKLAEGKDGHHAVRSALNELIKHGYLARGERVRNERGQLGPYQYRLTDPL